MTTLLFDNFFGPQDEWDAIDHHLGRRCSVTVTGVMRAAML
eukprot:CAMPEP_0180702902 /NCGR_PEP_ID=MMETSP1038_2-20121128/6356_1 /TAXON_ID=632150 /ORGANISM="Azadinium spinosum, Strain 3D9" /LENGTH=40 /DNA_ID= /DNA_START= /DNA_END= /DNA_ORIENTATION=